ncbi:transposase [Rubritalea squalenifaciens DSM 18772]|uniref:Transposase n=1 Tax=Rubritalea squalenifaciens DSM 18772 TaxID=1123071 RepID=A0A1M6SNN4_9BACT|nr:IS66 family insertion sequence element accessory protein TnpB [Rubritalea squalenifaciens]SHK46354.1 transposase [Rubritalea squalenifaciens DSM 18772]
MLSFSGSLKVYLATEPCDMRKSFNGLSAVVAQKLGADPVSGAAFLFTNKKKTLIKILYWDGSGLWVMAKRLEKGTFSWPKHTGGKTRIRLEPTALAMLTDGIQLRDGHKLPWYEKP